MTAAKAKRLSSLLHSAIKSPNRQSDLSTSFDINPSCSSSSPKPFLNLNSNQHSPPNFHNVAACTSASESDWSDAEDSTQLQQELSYVLREASSDSQKADDKKPLEKVLKLPWFKGLSSSSIAICRKETSRERKQKWVFKSTQPNRFDRVVNMCANRVGSETTLKVFGRLGRETGLKEYNALIRICIQNAMKSNTEDEALEQAYKAYQVLESVKEQGFNLEEETYGPFLAFIIEMSWVEEFKFFCDLIKDADPSSNSRLGYYEMLLWIRVDDEEKIKDLCEYITADYEEDESDLRENYFLALCESHRKKELLQMLEIIDITKISSLDCLNRIFKCLGKLSLEFFAEKFLLVFKTHENRERQVSNFIFNYAISIPNLTVEDIILKFKDLHAKLEIQYSSSSFENLIIYCCELSKVHMALDIVDEMCESGLSLSIKTLNSIIHACEENYEFNLVRRIYSIVCDHDLKPNNETFRGMISLSVRMKDYQGADSMLDDLKKMNLMPTSSMYNAILAGYSREKDTHGALMTLKKMERDDVKPDSQTFSYLISNCESEEDIIMYCEKLKQGGIPVTKQIFMSLINAYANCGQFEKAKQVVLDKGIPVKYLSEIKSVLVSALASHGLMSDALDVYDEIRQAGCTLEPKAVISLISNIPYDGELPGLLHLLEELKVTDYWADACCRIIMYCVRHKHLRDAVDLLKQLKANYFSGELDMDTIFGEVCSVIANAEPEHLQIGLELLDVIKDEFGISPTRQCLDFLLSACVNAIDLRSAIIIFKEYQQADLPYNVISYLRMYQALLVSGEHKAADIFLERIPQDDFHVRTVIRAYQLTYNEVQSVGKKKKRKKKKKKKNVIMETK